MNKVNEILTEWTYQLESGYPKKDEDYIVLQNILQESTDFDQSKIHRIVDRARGLQEDEVPNEVTNDDTPENIPDSEVNVVVTELMSVFRNIANKYAEYIRVINSFAPGSVGSMSESILAGLINKYTNATAEAVGMKNELTDITVGTHHISLKASLGSKVIPLSVDTKNWPIGQSAESKTKWYEKYQKYAAGSEGDKTEPYGDKSIKFLQTINQMKNSEESEIYNIIINRLIAIAKKLSDVNFIWIEKEIPQSSKILKSLTIHVREYEYENIMKEFLNSYLYLSPKAWGLVGEDGTIIIGAETGKELNIHPRFIKKTGTEENTQRIEFPIPTFDRIEKQKEVTDAMLNSLEQISQTLYGK